VYLLKVNWIDGIHKRFEWYPNGGGGGEISEYILSNISFVNKAPFCIEFGHSFGTKPGQGWWRHLNISNSIHKGWDFFVLGRNMVPIPDINNMEEPWAACPSPWWRDQGYEKCGRGGFHNELLTSENICDIFKKYNSPEEPEWVSIDVDSIELWLMKSMLKKYRPLLIQVEANCWVEGEGHYFKHSITQQDGPYIPWERYKDRCGGASLRALDTVTDGYTLVHASIGGDAHFVRNDRIKGLKHPRIEDPSTIFPPKFLEYLNSESSGFRKRAQSFRYDTMIDYYEYLSSGGDIDKSRAKARPICEKYL